LSRSALILILILLCSLSPCVRAQQRFGFDFFGDSVSFQYEPRAHIAVTEPDLSGAVTAFFDDIEKTDAASVLQALQHYKDTQHPDDWIFYQLIRKTAQAISPKAGNYYQYTLYKCFLLAKSGYDVSLNVVGDKLLFFVQSDDDIYDIPSFRRDGKRYICLNFHDYGYDLGLDRSEAKCIALDLPATTHGFSYKLTHLPRFRAEHYYTKDLKFSYLDVDYSFKVKLNDEIKQIFANYPVTDYGLYLNSPLSEETYNTLIPDLKKHIAHMSVRHGVDYLMHFTRYAFPYEADVKHFGREKHLSPEQTLLYDSSDCEDRAALFYCLVKEIYNIPMVILAFPQHITVAVKLEKPVGRQIVYNGVSYSVCEPTPQADDLPIGSLPQELRRADYQIAYAYTPGQ
jgi:hypothetical protein